MKTINYIVFFGAFFTVYGLVNYYVFIRGWQAVPHDLPHRSVYLSLFLLLSLSFVGGRFLERIWLSPLSDLLVWIGSFWLAAMLYFVLAILLIDLLRLVDHFVPFFPMLIRSDYARTKLITAGAVTSVVVLVLAAGHINTLFPRVRELHLRIHKKVDGVTSFRIVAASDIHLGTIVGRRRLKSIVERINGLNPDIVLLPGDIVDEDLAPVVRENLGETLRQIRAPYGVLAVTGNHEYIGGAEEACRYLEEHGVTMLRDSVVRLGNGVSVVGREDRSVSQFSGRRRASLRELLSAVDAGSPVVLMDHQPFHLDEAASLGVDLQLSGHTHHGQLWPFNFITAAVYELSWGYLQKGDMHVYVSSGVGTWGPPVRIGNVPEIVSIVLQCE